MFINLQYVRVVSCLYSKVWRKRFENRSCRLMMDPTFAVSKLIGIIDDYCGMFRLST